MSEAPSSGQDKGTIEIEWSTRQREVLDLLAARKTNGEIASTLGISLDGAK
jgi:DNA-binding NarL/FixJ family response regulator